MGKPKIAKSMRWPLPVGTKVWFEPMLGNDTPFHVRGYVDGLIIGRSWCFARQRWTYGVHSKSPFDLYLKEGRLRIQYPKKKRQP